MNIMFNTTATKPTRWIDSVAHTYSEDNRFTPGKLCNLYAELESVDELSAELAQLECHGDCGATGRGNDPDRTECACELGDYDIFREIRPAADRMHSGLRRVDPLMLRNGVDVHLYTVALRAWHRLEAMRHDDRVMDIVEQAEQIQGELA